jgi:L-fuconate dehydratase
MTDTVITAISARDARYLLKPGEGVDAVHNDPVYAYAVTQLHTLRAARAGHGDPLTGIGLAMTEGDGNDLVCRAIEWLAAPLVGQPIESVMANFGVTFRKIADHPRLRWLGPHKGVVHLALASITNACFDLWAKSRGVPLWRLLLDLTPEQIVAALDLSYLENILTTQEALDLLRGLLPTRPEREGVTVLGYPGYDTSIGWFHYTDEQVAENIRRAVGAGFTAMKLKVGSADEARDVRRAHLVRRAAGDTARVMLDCNQQWTVPQAIRMGYDLAAMRPYWIEEPTHPDDVYGHLTIANAIAPIKVAAGEHMPNRVVFKNFLQTNALGFCQVDCVRVGGVSEFIAISLMAKKLGVPVVPHVGDMGQIHQHLVLFNHIGIGHPLLFLEYIPHLREHFVHPARVEGGVYRTPQEPGSSADLL